MGIQCHFIEWCQNEEVDSNIANLTTVLNFLAWGHALLGWSARTVTTYRSQLVAMYPEPAIFDIDPNFSKFFWILLANQVAKTVDLELDLHPIL